MALKDISFRSQSIGLTDICNARELGGYVLPDGKIRHGKLLRGGSLCNASAEDLDKLANQFKIVRVFDFRTSNEVKRAPNKTVEGAVNIWLPAFDEQSQTMASNAALPQEAFLDLVPWLLAHAKYPEVQEAARNLYTDMVFNDFTQAQYAGFLQNILNVQGESVYWHCSQGKDRTGLGAAFILSVLGADRELVMADYALSNEFYRNDLDEVLDKVDTLEEKKVLQTFIGVNCEYFERALDLIDERYGSMKKFLTGPLCLDEEDIIKLKKYYLYD